ncbi:hypothetical protein IS481_12115 [Caldimonas thermodepolymerans]|uniref:Uncharacterized protein n=1 Tax=Caldimonas thermodepolymerans TaxID=215580 RepID=A0A2S5T9E6_9BURK|nr:hypothetical protein [Caldimonas thermodepolymerans]PPE71487.1 hypothetical protein C1702_00340 [Caldimonas thermodepolymerans]QPC30515.1 hypothetical protein IS481_12115 [Caldimonas thermodepolymerans]RDI02899.1 hypothetical protein DES46_102327 [Caldimonas thermodepolymerans]
MTEKTKIQVIRERFEETLVDILRGRPVIDKDGVLATREDGTPLIERPQAADLNVVRAYLKDSNGSQDGKELPKTGEPQGILKSFLEHKGRALPFAGSVTPQ